MGYRVGDKVRIIKPLYSDNPRLGETMQIRQVKDGGTVVDYILKDIKDEWHCVKKDEIELIQGFRTFKEIEEINKNRELKNKHKTEEVDHPAHYNQGIEAIDYIESHSMNFNLGNVIKYITRCEHKENKVKDLEKAKFYIQREIDKMGVKDEK